jgi:hypothetical protein
MATKEITWTKPMFKRFKKAYADAVAAQQANFVFDGHDFLVSYSKYLIEYLESKLG